MSDKRQLVFDAFDNKETQRVPVGFWFHFAPDDLFTDRPDVIRRNVEGHSKERNPLDMLKVEVNFHKNSKFEQFLPMGLAYLC